MENYFEKQTKYLYDKANDVVNSYTMLKANRAGEKLEIEIPQDFKDEFFNLVDKVNLSLMEEKDNFLDIFYFKWQEI